MRLDRRIRRSRVTRGKPVDDARGGDNFIGRVAVEVQRVDGAASIQRKRPGLDSGQCSRQLRIIEVEFNAAQLRELRNFPKHDPRNTSGIVR